MKRRALKKRYGWVIPWRDLSPEDRRVRRSALRKLRQRQKAA
jgi:hypothetical protein